jgi:hypothetical protein
MTTRPSEPGIDRFDVIAALGVVAMIVGALAVHPALLVISAAARATSPRTPTTWCTTST